MSKEVDPTTLGNQGRLPRFLELSGRAANWLIDRLSRDIIMPETAHKSFTEYHVCLQNHLLTLAQVSLAESESKPIEVRVILLRGDQGGGNICFSLQAIPKVSWVDHEPHYLSEARGIARSLVVYKDAFRTGTRYTLDPAFILMRKTRIKNGRCERFDHPCERADIHAIQDLTVTLTNTPVASLTIQTLDLTTSEPQIRGYEIDIGGGQNIWGLPVGQGPTFFNPSPEAG